MSNRANDDKNHSKFYSSMRIATKWNEKKNVTRNVTVAIHNGLPFAFIAQIIIIIIDIKLFVAVRTFEAN